MGRMTELMDDLVTDRAPRKRRRRAGVAGIVLLAIGVLSIGWLGWQFVGSSLLARQQHATRVHELRTAWEQGDPLTVEERPRAGQAFAILRVPRWGESYEVPVLAGIGARDLARGVGAYPSSVPPGQVGNLAIAGYRTTHAAPFGRLLELDQGDEVVLETGTAVYTYVIDVPARDVTVRDNEAWVLDPVPGTADDPTRPTLTLTTSQDLVRSPDRSVAFGHLGSTRNK